MLQIEPWRPSGNFPRQWHQTDLITDGSLAGFQQGGGPWLQGHRLCKGTVATNLRGTCR